VIQSKVGVCRSGRVGCLRPKLGFLVNRDGEKERGGLPHNCSRMSKEMREKKKKDDRKKRRKKRGRNSFFLMGGDAAKKKSTPFGNRGSRLGTGCLNRTRGGAPTKRSQKTQPGGEKHKGRC